MSDIPVPKAFLAMQCDCGHDLIVVPAEDPGDALTTFNFVGQCHNVPETCHHQAWTATVTVSETALQADAASRHAARQERDRVAPRAVDDDEASRPYRQTDEEICHHPVGNGECILPAGHAGVHRLTEA